MWDTALCRLGSKTSPAAPISVTPSFSKRSLIWVCDHLHALAACPLPRHSSWPRARSMLSAMGRMRLHRVAVPRRCRWRPSRGRCACGSCRTPPAPAGSCCLCSSNSFWSFSRASRSWEAASFSGEAAAWAASPRGGSGSSAACSSWGAFSCVLFLFHAVSPPFFVFPKGPGPYSSFISTVSMLPTRWARYCVSAVSFG